MRRMIALLVLACLSLAVFAADGLIAVESTRGAKDTMDRLESAVKERNLNVFARIDHAAGATKIGRKLRATEVLIFGNPQGGTPLMECAQSAGIDLPLKALVWQDEAGKVWVGYNDPAYLAARHGAASCPAAAGLAKALASLVQEALK